MFVQSTLLSKLSITNITLKLFLSFMETCNMFVQITFLFKFSITNDTIELFLSFMNFYNVFSFKIPFSPKLELQSHLNGFFLSWAILTCIFKLTLFPKPELQMSHLNFLFPSWTVVMWQYCDLEEGIRDIIQTEGIKKFHPEGRSPEGWHFFNSRGLNNIPNSLL